MKKLNSKKLTRSTLTQKEKHQLKGGGKRGGKSISVPATEVS